ncbi:MULTISPECIES: hypothetical protein [Enterococcus]|uniref:Uncharacterized protein n=1 Tax=Enterococcus sulfureus ATCC 49903 TaxID=1140003 RepID=S0NP21_9ENTE|nr:hypothetical protein [Enterococcus sulfureus]EOT82979.1 hypothetical protein I573_02092 [Enterococcus sulfureus ATCC 49903]
MLKNNKQLDDQIQAIFQSEKKRAYDHSEKKEKKTKLINIVLAVTMSVLILGSLVYSLLTAVFQ